MTINGEDHGVLGTPLVASHESPEATRRRAVGCIGLMVVVAAAAVLTVACCGGIVLAWRLS